MTLCKREALERIHFPLFSIQGIPISVHSETTPNDFSHITTLLCWELRPLKPKIISTAQIHRPHTSGIDSCYPYNIAWAIYNTLFIVSSCWGRLTWKSLRQAVLLAFASHCWDNPRNLTVVNMLVLCKEALKLLVLCYPKSFFQKNKWNLG